MKQPEKLTDKPRLLKELADAYHVDSKTFKSWIESKTLSHIEPKGYYYNINQVTEIVNHLEEPY